MVFIFLICYQDFSAVLTTSVLLGIKNIFRCCGDKLSFGDQPSPWLWTVDVQSGCFCYLSDAKVGWGSSKNRQFVCHMCEKLNVLVMSTEGLEHKVMTAALPPCCVPLPGLVSGGLPSCWYRFSLDLLLPSARSACGRGFLWVLMASWVAL